MDELEDLILLKCPGHRRISAYSMYHYETTGLSFVETGEKNPKTHTEPQRTLKVQSFGKKNEAAIVMLPNLKISHNDDENTKLTKLP